MLYFLSHPIQYFSPLFKMLGEKVGLEVYYYSDNRTPGKIDKGFGRAVSWDIPLLEGYSYHFLENKVKSKVPNSRFWDVFNPGVVGCIRRSPEKIVVINGWSYSSDWLVAVSGRILGKKIWIRAENPLNQELRKPRWVRGLKKLILGKFLFALFTDQCLYIGAESKKFFEYFGVPADRLLFTPYAVDNAYFNNAWLENRGRLPALKSQLGLPADKKIIVFVGKYIPKKRPLDLLKACRQLNAEEFFLVMVGDGELKGVMEDYIRDHQMSNVLLTGFINQSAIPQYYSVSDVFVMCSGMGETWGLTVNEAMNFEKPIVVSDTCGCSRDLVKQGVNGYVFPEGDIDALAGYIKEVTKDDIKRVEMGKASYEIVQSYSVPVIVNNIHEKITG